MTSCRWMAAFLVPAVVFSGCTAAGPSAYDERPASLAQDAPTAQEMETPVADAGRPPLPDVPPEQNGGGKLPEAAVKRERPKPEIPSVEPHPSEIIDEKLRMRNEDLHGYNFPGVDDVARRPGQPTPSPADEQLDKRLKEAEARLEELELELKDSPEKLRKRVKEMEARVAELEGRKPEPVAEDVETLEGRYRDLNQRLARLEAQQAAEAALKASPKRLQRRLQDVEQRLAAVEDRPAEPVEVTADNIDERFDALKEKLAQLEDHQSALAELKSSPKRLERRLQDVEQRLAEAEDRTAEAVQVTRDNLDERFEALKEKLAKLEDIQAAPAPGGVGLTGSAPAFRQEPYRIGAGDILEFQSFDDETLSRELTVRYDGHVSLPLIPDIQVTKLTREEAEQKVREAYNRVFRDPQISLLVRQTSSKTFTIFGDISQPGVYPYDQATTLIEAISLAGGLRERNTGSSVGGFVGITGQLTKAFIIRHIDGERRVFQYDMRGLGKPGAHAADVPVYHGDLIYIPEGVNLVYVLGESRNPVIVELTEGMTLLQLLSLSGGFNTSTARLRDVALIRQVDEEHSEVMSMNVRKMLKTGQDFPLVAGDIVYIPRKRLLRLSEFVERLTGSVTPILDLYNTAVESFYAIDIAEQAAQEPTVDAISTSDRLQSLGDSTQQLIDIFGDP